MITVLLSIQSLWDNARIFWRIPDV